MGELIKAIPEDELKAIDNYISWYSDNDSGDMPPEGRRANIKDILRPWEENKEKLFHMFGDKLILSKKYTYYETASVIVKRICDDTDWYSFRNILGDALNKLRVNKVLLNISLEEEAFTYWRDNADYYFHLFETDCARNQLSETITLNYNGKKLVFQEGMKYMRYLGRLSEIAGVMDAFESFRLQHSMIFNNSKQHGNLCLSIHPLDFMTMSDNMSDWDSCMSWQNHGCYRMGTVEMMNSPTVVVAYLEASEPMRIGKIDWNNKKWRQLFVINEHVITSVKPYPYFDDNMTKECLTWLNKLTNGEYSEETYEFSDGENRYQNLYRLAASCNQMYNDFASCSHLTKIKLPIPEKKEGIIRRWNFNYSGPTECMWCGTTNGYFNADSLYCEDCCDSNAVCCCNCGDRIYPDSDDYYVSNDGDYYCCDCRDELFAWDEVWEEYVWHDDAIELWLPAVRDEVNYDHDRMVLTSTYNCDRRWLKKNEDCDYYVNIDEAPQRVLQAIFGSGSYSNARLKSYIISYGNGSYAGMTHENLTWRNWRDNSSYEERLPIE